MKDEITKINSQKLELDEEKAESSKPYSSPRLKNYGDIRGVTMGASPGVGESGAFKV